MPRSPKNKALETARKRSAKELSRFSAASARSMQRHVGRSIESILQTAATRGEAAGLAELRRAMQAAERSFASTASAAQRSAAVSKVQANTTEAVARTIGPRIQAAKGTAEAKAAAMGRVRNPNLGRRGAHWKGELQATLRNMNKVNTAGLFKKLKPMLGVAARRGARGAIASNVMRKMVERARGTVVKQSQIGSRRAINIATDRSGTLASLVTQANAKALGADKYVWTTVGDDNVRDEHAAREGRTFRFSQPPADGNPGEPINCRCTAQIVIGSVK